MDLEMCCRGRGGAVRTDTGQARTGWIIHIRMIYDKTSPQWKRFLFPRRSDKLILCTNRPGAWIQNSKRHQAFICLTNHPPNTCTLDPKVFSVPSVLLRGGYGRWMPSVAERRRTVLCWYGEDQKDGSERCAGFAARKGIDGEAWFVGTPWRGWCDLPVWAEEHIGAADRLERGEHLDHAVKCQVTFLYERISLIWSHLLVVLLWVLVLFLLLNLVISDSISLNPSTRSEPAAMRWNFRIFCSMLGSNHVQQLAAAREM